MRTRSYKVSYESMISRLPSLFPFLEMGEGGKENVVAATHGEQGCYGKIVANIDLSKPLKSDGNNGITFYHKLKDGKELRLKSKEYSYRTLIDTYYKAINDKNWERNKEGVYEDCFLAFMEKGIGLKYVGLSEEESGLKECGVEITKKYPLAPNYIYLGEAQLLYDKFIKMKKQIEFMKHHSEACKDDKKYYEKLEEEYKLSNGDKLLDKLEQLIEEADSIAKKYLEYSIDTKAHIDFNVFLPNTIKDLGAVTPYIEEWIPGKRYYNEDVVYHVDDNGYGMTWMCKITDKQPKKDDVGTYTEGNFDEETETILFDKENWIPQSLNWVERNNVEVGNETKNIKYTNNQESSQKISGTVNSHLQSLRRFTTYMNSRDEAEYPSNFKDWLWYYRIGIIVNREASYDDLGNIGVLHGEIDEDRGVAYADGVEPIQGGDEHTNLIIEDGYVTNLAIWGDCITDITASNSKENPTGEIEFTYWLGVHLLAKYNGCEVDENGKYTYFFEDFKPDLKGIYGKNHGVKYTEKYIYNRGNQDKVSTANITYNDKDGKWEIIDVVTEENRDRIEYFEGQVINYSTWNSFGDDKKKYFKSLDMNIWSLVEEGKFSDYVNGKYDYGNKPLETDDGSNINYYLYEKMEFDYSYSMDEYNFQLGTGIKNVPYVKSNFETTIDITHVDIEETPLVRYDYYNGVSFQPNVNDNVDVERGLTQAFEKHFKLGEIKTMEDMENYANGGFFVISKEDIDLG